MAKYRNRVAAAVAIAAISVGGVSAVSAANSTTTTTKASKTKKVAKSTAANSQYNTRTGRGAHTPLTGDIAAKVTAAALAKVPGGTIGKLHTGHDSAYVAHVTKADGTEVRVRVDAAFNATAVVAGHTKGHGPHGGGHGGGRHGGSGETALTGDRATKVTAAALAKVPGGTIIRVETDNDGVYEAHVKKTDGTEVEVQIDAQFNVTAVHQH